MNNKNWKQLTWTTPDTSMPLSVCNPFFLLLAWSRTNEIQMPSCDNSRSSMLLHVLWLTCLQQLGWQSDHPSPMIKKVLPRRYGQHMPPTLSNCHPTSLRPISFFADKKRWTLTYRHEVAEANLKRWLNDTNIWFSYRDWPTSSQLHIFRFEPSVKLRAQIGPDSAAKRRRPKPLKHASQLFSATEPPFTRKNTMFRANPNVQIAPMM